MAQQQAEELRQELEKLQAAQEELRRQHTQLEDEQEDTVQEGARTRRELERRFSQPHSRKRSLRKCGHCGCRRNALGG